MKEGKSTTKKNNAKKTNNKPSNSHVKEVKEAKIHEEKTKVHEEKTKVHEEKVSEVEDFLDDEEDDKRLIVFIVIAILVIVATIIGLLVGCEKEEKEIEEPKKPDDTIVGPQDEEDNKEEEEVVEKGVAVKSTKTNETTKYNVTFYMNGYENVKTVKKGNKVSKYTPEGYTNCKYYTDEELTNEYNFNKPVTGNNKIYMSCELIHYEIIYSEYSNNPTDYTVEDGNITLSEPLSYEGIFKGWYLNNNKVAKLTRDIISYANKDHQIHLTANLVDHLNVYYYDYEGKEVSRDEVTKDTLDSYAVQSGNDAYCSTNEKFLGWASTIDSNNITSDLRLKEDLEDKSLYAVCGLARVVYKSGDEEVVVGYNKEELDEYELPTPDELGMEVPTYFVPVDEETLNSKKVVADDKETLEENEVKLSDVANKSANGYNPQVGDNVEEKEKVFKGWKETETEPLEDSTNQNNVATASETGANNEVVSDEVSGDTAPIVDNEVLPNTNEVEAQSTEPTTESEVNGSEVVSEGNTEPTTETVTEPVSEPLEQTTTPEPKTEVTEEVVPDDYKPEENKDTTLEAVWEEQPVEGVGEEI